MTNGRRVVTLVALIAFFGFSVPILGLPYQPMKALASDMRQYEPSPTPFATCLVIRDQDVTNGVVVVEKACASRRGWVAIYNDSGGVPGEVIGLAQVLKGVTRGVQVQIDMSQVTSVLFGRLHQDRQTPGQFDGQGDPPETGFVEFMVTFTRETPSPTGTLQAGATHAATATQVRTSAATPTPVTAPRPSAVSLGLMLAGLCFLTTDAVVAIVIVLRRRRRRP